MGGIHGIAGTEGRLNGITCGMLEWPVVRFKSLANPERGNLMIRSYPLERRQLIKDFTFRQFLLQDLNAWDCDWSTVQDKRF